MIIFSGKTPTQAGKTGFLVGRTDILYRKDSFYPLKIDKMLWKKEVRGWKRLFYVRKSIFTVVHFYNIQLSVLIPLL